MQTYRILYDGDARRLYDRAVRDFDLHPLRTIAYRYPQTTIAPKALDLLASWLLDRGEATEAIDVLGLLSGLEQGGVPRFDVLQKRAVAYTLTGQRARVIETLMSMREILNQADATSAVARRDRLEATQRFFENDKTGSAGRHDHELYQPWTQLLGPAARSGHAPSIDPVINEDAPWHDTLPGTDQVDETAVRHVMTRKARPPVWQAVTDGAMLFVSCPGGVVARDLATFDYLWESFPASQPRDPRIAGFRRRVFPAEQKPEESLDRLSTRTLFHEYAGSITVGHGLVFVIDQAETDGEQRPSPNGTVRPLSPDYGESGPTENTLRAFESATLAGQHPYDLPPRCI